MAVAAAVRRLPDFRGRQRLSRAILGTPAVHTLVRYGPGIELNLDLSDADQRMAFFLQSQPPVLAPIFDEVVGAGSVVIDVGANQGIYTLWAARRAVPGGSVHAFEPIESTRLVLEENVRRNRLCETVVVQSAAVGSGCGSLMLYTVPQFSGLTSPYRRSDDAELVEVQVTSLDLYCEQMGIVPHLVKIDIEGFETEALRGMSMLLHHAHPPVVILECIRPQLEQAGSSVDELMEEIHRTGMEAWALHRKGLRPFTKTSTDDGNLVLLHPTRHADYLKRLQSTRFARDSFP